MIEYPQIVAEALKAFESDDVEEIGSSILTFIELGPTGDDGVIAHLETAVNDSRIYKMFLPGGSTLYIYYFELRWLAAFALLAEYKALGRQETITLKNVLKPIEKHQLHQIALEKGLLLIGDQRFETLREMGLLPYVNATFDSNKPIHSRMIFGGGVDLKPATR